MRGILINVVNKMIQKQLGIPVSHKGYLWAEAQQKVRDGEADAFISVPTPERREYFKKKALKKPEVKNEYTVLSISTTGARMMGWHHRHHPFLFQNNYRYNILLLHRNP